jgi:hypothetical protein
MNERIGKLVEQAEEWVCKNYPDAMDDSDEFHSQTMAKFAELLINECAETVQDFVDHRFPASEYPVRLRRYFGVEE